MQIKTIEFEYGLTVNLGNIIRTGVITIAEQPTTTPDDGDSSYPRGDEGWGDEDEDEEE